ncbi:MAG: polysaccharide biosynthesis/export family protein [Terracidiphilus sp.]|jgi:polysaccharide export outer membrane protein
MKSSTDITLKRNLLLAAICLVSVAALGQSPADQAAGNEPSSIPAAPTAAPVDPSIHTGDPFVIGNDDILAINVWKELELSKQVTVRSDGKISLPLIGDIQAAGQTPSQLEMEITERYKNYITNPQVAVIVQEIHSLKFNVLGQVTKPGTYPLTTGTTVVDAIAAAGGLKDFAKKKGIYVLRQNPGGGEFRYIFNYEEFVKGKNPKQNIVLKSHDTVVVP